MREIKFRAWDKEDRRMIVHEQDFIPLRVCSLGVLRLDPHNEQNLWQIMPGSRFNLMQYTGLKDKNGKEIYEGDIIATKFYPRWVERVSWKGDPDAIAEVYWDFEGFGLKAKGKEDFRYPDLYEVNFKHTEIIGNIYQHPHLLAPETVNSKI